MAENKDIEKAVTALAANQAKYEKATAYYNGEHSLKFATDKFRNAFGTLFKEFALNLCPAVCDAVRDKLTVTGWKVEAGADTVTKKAWEIWQANRMGVRARQIHREAIVAGDAYAIVWVDPDKKTTIYPQKAMSCTVIYNVETPGKIDMAAKYWLIDGEKKDKKKARLNLYYADRIERYVTKKDLDSTTLPGKVTDWVEFTDDGEFSIPNPYKRVPVFHFGNNADIGSFGKSEIAQAIPVQDALNKSVLDMLIAMEFSAFRQRWATGVEIEEDADGNAKPPFIAGAERLWVTENTETKFGDFAASDIKQFLEVKDGFRMDLAAVTGTPLHYFMQIGASFPSGESLRKAETRFINKVNDRQESFGQVWEDVMSFALTIENEQVGDTRLFTEWEDPSPLSEKEMLDNISLKVDLGISEEQALIEAGYGAADIKKMMDANAKKAQDAVDRFNAGEDLGGEGDDGSIR